MPVTISFNIKSIATTALGSNASVRFELQNCGANQPRIIGTGVIAQRSYEFKPNDSGSVSGSIYGNNEIDAGGEGNTYYTIAYLVNGVPQFPPKSYVINTGSTFDPSIASPITSTPTVDPPTGDNTYLQLSCGNSVSFAGFLDLKRQNGILYADKYSAVDNGAKINAAIADVSDTGGVVDARGISDAGFSTTIAISKPCTLLLPTMLTYTGTGSAISVTSKAVVIQGLGQRGENSVGAIGSYVACTNNAATGLTGTAADGLCLSHVHFGGPDTGGTGKGLNLIANGAHLSDVQVTYFGSDGVYVDGSGTNMSDLGVLTRVRSSNNGGNGFKFVGGLLGNANGWAFICTNAYYNQQANYDIDSFSNHFVVAHANSAFGGTDFIIRGHGNTGSIYSEPVAPSTTALQFTGSDASYNNLFLLNGRVVSDSGVGNQWYFASSDATYPGGTHAYWLTETNANDTLNKVRQVARTGGNELTEEGVYFKSASFRSGYTIRSARSLNLLYDTADDGYEFNIFRAAATDGAIGTNTPVFQVDGTGLTKANSGLTVGSGTEITKHLSATTTWDPASIADGAMTSTTVTVTGAAIGDTVAVGFSQAVPAGAMLVGAVTATNTVTVTLFNKTGGNLDLDSGTLRADVWQH